MIYVKLTTTKKNIWNRFTARHSRPGCRLRHRRGPRRSPDRLRHRPHRRQGRRHRHRRRPPRSSTRRYHHPPAQRNKKVSFRFFYFY